MSERSAKVKGIPHLTSFDDVFSDKAAKHMGRNGKTTSTEETSLIFTLQGKYDLEQIMTSLKAANVQISHSETRRSGDDGKIDVYIECEEAGRIDDVIEHLETRDNISNVRNSSSSQGPAKEGVPWFPKCLSDLDRSAENCFLYGSELDADHPGFKDPVYRKRRALFSEIAKKYRNGQPIPRVQYTEEESKTWKKVFNELTSLYPTHACAEHIRNMEVLARHCGFIEDNIPQLEEVSEYLQKTTGFRLRPVEGFLSPRDFLAGLAFKVFHCTQYMRHSSDPFYTPEPDVVHELLGHAPLLAEPSFAEFSHEIGLASLGASEEDISRLAACYLYTVEFGLCKENGKPKAYGAGLLSCIAELKHALTSPEVIKPFDPEVASKQEFYVTTFQPVYFLSETLEEAKEKMRSFARSIQKPFTLTYDKKTNTVQVVEEANRLHASKIQSDSDKELIHSAGDDRDCDETNETENVTNGQDGVLESTTKPRRNACDVITDLQNNAGE